VNANPEPQLAASAVSPETAKRAGVTRITSADARRLGFSGNAYDAANLAGLAFPYRDPRTGAEILTRIRPDVAVNGRKYLAPVGSRNRLYLPFPTSALLEDIRFPAVITEGEKKTLAVAEATEGRYLAVGVSGVWNWRTSDKEKRPLRDRPGTETVRVNSRPIEDLDWITWKGRRAYIVFDSDGAANADIQRAEKGLADELRKRGATPLVVSLQNAVSGGKQGIDDLLAPLAPESRFAAFERLLHAAAPRRRASIREDQPLTLVWDPPGGFLRTFDEFADEQTDAPAVYRPFAALTVLSAVLGRQVSAPWFGHAPLIPNLYTCLLGASSFAHKTTMITMAERLIRGVRPERLLPDEFTPEKFLGLLSKSPEAFLGLPEFAGFLARSGRDYNVGTRELFMQLYDCPDEYRRALQKEEITVKQPAVTVLGASATSWLSDAMKGGDLRSGFFNRFCFVVGDRQDKTFSLPGTTVDGRSQFQLMLGQLKQVAEVKGPMDYNRVRKSYDAWYGDLKREGGQTEPVEVVSAFYARLAATAMKIAMLIEVSQTRNLMITDASLQEAIVLVDYLRAAIKWLLKVEFAPSPFAKQAQRVLTVIRGNPGIQRGWILKKTGFSGRELTPILDTLVEQGDAYEQDRKWWVS
jgi:hypothetical protein